MLALVNRGVHLIPLQAVHFKVIQMVHFILIYPVHLKVIWAVHLKCCNQVLFRQILQITLKLHQLLYLNHRNLHYKFLPNKVLHDKRQVHNRFPDDPR